MNTHSNSVTLLVGSPIEEPGEQRFIARLVDDLNRRHVTATLFANFYTAGSDQKQVDLLVWTPHRVLTVELKSLDPGLPVVAPTNGHWTQGFPNGSTRSLGKNAYEQAIKATYAISDCLGRLVRGGRKPYLDIDTVVCIDPRIPAGSSIARREHVTVLGYDALLERISEPAKRQPFDAETWAVFARELNVYDPSDVECRANDDELISYRHHSAATWSSTAALVELGLMLDGVPTEPTKLSDHLLAGSCIGLTAPSGWGKTHLARHMAVEITARSAMVLWLRADEYERGRFGPLLSRSASPYSSTRVMDLIATAVRAGTGIVLVVDALDTAPPAERSELLEQLASFRLRYATGILLTSTSDLALPEALRGPTAQLAQPTDEQRAAVLHAHGWRNEVAISPAFRTPHELSLAAACATELGPAATAVDLHDAYIRKVAAAETTRHGLRDLSTWLHEHHRSSASRRDVALHLGAQSGAALPPSVVDDVLASPLLDHAPGVVRFRHDLFRDFLAAEMLVRTASDAADLARHLREPRNRHLERTVLELEPDADRVVEVLDMLADSARYSEAMLGSYGEATASRLRNAAAALLAEAVDATRPDAVSEFEVSWHGRFKMSRTWAPSTMGILQAAGFLLLDEHLDAVGALLDASDSVAHGHIAAGAGQSEVVSSLYAHQFNLKSSDLPVVFVVAGVDRRAMALRFEDEHLTNAFQHLMADPNAGWGRCYLSAQVFDARRDAGHLGRLLSRCIQVGGYHVELHGLWAAERNAGVLDPQDRTDVLEVLENYQPTHWGLSSTAVEIFAALGQIEPLSTLDDIREALRLLVKHPDYPNAAEIAASAWARQFEDERILGPYHEAIEELEPSDRLRLLLLAGSAEYVWLGGVLFRELADAAPTGDAQLDRELEQLFMRRAALDTGDPMPQEQVEIFVEAVRGLGRLGIAVPLPDEEASDDELAWRLMGEVLRSISIGAPAEGAWRRASDAVPAAIADVLLNLERAQMGSAVEGRESVHALVLTNLPEQVRDVLHWSVGHLNGLTSLWGDSLGRDRQSYVIRTLGRVGDGSTIAHLTGFADDPRYGSDAVAALRQINERLAGTS